jgi:hypothetical protein
VIPGQPEITSEITDQMELDYRVDAVAPTGAMVVRVRVRDVIRDTETPDQSLMPGLDDGASQLEDAVFQMEVGADGIVTGFSTSYRDRVIAKLSAARNSSYGVLRDLLSDDQLRAWLARPFWLAATSADVATQKPWDRGDFIGLGPLGHLRINVRCEVPAVPASSPPAAAEPPETSEKKPEDSATTDDTATTDENLTESIPSITGVTLTGTGTYVPQVQRGSGGARIPLSVISSEFVLDEYRGEAKFVQELPQIDTHRPRFDELMINSRYHGTCELKVQNRPITASFHQEQTQVWSVIAWHTDDVLPSP